MIPVPVLSPRGDLQGAEPPDVLARVHAVGKSGLQVKKTVDEGLHMEAIHEANGAQPEESRPSEKKVSERKGQNDQVWLNSCPEQVTGMDQIRAPLVHAGRIPLIQPPEVSPPEASVSGA